MYLKNTAESWKLIKILLALNLYKLKINLKSHRYINVSIDAVARMLGSNTDQFWSLKGKKMNT